MANSIYSHPWYDISWWQTYIWHWTIQYNGQMEMEKAYLSLVHSGLFWNQLGSRSMLKPLYISSLSSSSSAMSFHFFPLFSPSERASALHWIPKKELELIVMEYQIRFRTWTWTYQISAWSILLISLFHRFTNSYIPHTVWHWLVWVVQRGCQAPSVVIFGLRVGLTPHTPVLSVLDGLRVSASSNVYIKNKCMRTIYSSCS